MENEVTYLNYGNNKVDQKKFLENSANAVTNYVSQQPWSEKRKKLFLEAYSDLMNRGVTGASNDSGQWQILYNGDVGLDSKSKKQKEMYGEAAYFIQQQLNNSIAKEEKQEENKFAKFSNSDFISNLEGYIGTHQFGGQNFNIASQWNTLDKTDSKTGIRETQNRAKKLAESLRGYAQSLKDDSYNFENSPFTDINDFRNKLNEAANHLENGTWTPEILNKIGLDPEKYLSTGANDIINPETGQTRQQYIDALLEKEAEKQAEEIRLKRLKELAEQKENYGVLSRISGIHSKEARLIPEKYNEYLTKYGVGQKGFDTINNEIKSLLETAASSGLSNNQKRKLGNFLYHIRKNNPNYQRTNLSDQDWAELSKFKNLGSTNRNGFIRLPWQLADGRYTYADDKGNVYFLKPQNKQKLQGPAVDRNKLNNYRNNFLKGQLQLNNEKPVLSQDTDILISDMSSMLGDIISLGGGYAGLAGGVTTLVSDLYGDIRRGKDTWSTLKNLGANIAWGAAGLIPGAKLGKLAKNAARIYATLQSAGILMNDDIQQSWKNLISGKPITAKDFENFKWTLHAITGGTNAARGHFTEKNVARQVKSNNKPTIETKSGKKVTLTEEQAKKINRVGGRKGQKAAEEAFKKATGEEAKEGTFSFQENSRAWYNPNRYSQRLRNWTSDNERLVLPKTDQSVNTQAVNRLLEIDKAKPIFAPFSKKFWTTTELRKSGNPFNKRFWTEGGPNRGGLIYALAPYRNNSSNNSNNVDIDENPTRMLEGQTSQQYRQSQVGRTNPAVKNPSELPENVKFNRETLNEYKNTIIKSNFSNNKLQSGTNSLVGTPIQVVKQSDGTFNIIYKGNIISNERNQREIQKTIRNLIKNTVQQGKSNSSSKISAKEMGRLLKEFKAKGWLKQGGTIDKQKIHKYKEFINK